MATGDRLEVSITLVRDGTTVSHANAGPYEDVYDAGGAVQDCVGAVFVDPLPVLADALVTQAEAEGLSPDQEEAGLLDALYVAAKAYLDLKRRQDREAEAQARAIAGEVGRPPESG